MTACIVPQHRINMPINLHIALEDITKQEHQNTNTTSDYKYIDMFH